MRKFFEDVENYEFRIEIFSKLTGIWILINFIAQLPLYQSLWGGVENLILSRQAYGRKLPIILDLLTHFHFLAPLVYGITIIGAVLLIWGKRHLLLRIGLWYTVWLLDAQAWTVQDGGNNLMHLTLFYSILFDFRVGANSNMIPKMGIRAIQVQVLIIYFCAFLSKVSGPLWQNGTALHYIIQIDKFHSTLLLNLFQAFPILVPILSYFTILSQLILLTLLPVKKWRLLAIVLGVSIHLGIAFHIGLIMFSLVMIFHYSIFITKDDINFAKTYGNLILRNWKYTSIALLTLALSAAGIFYYKTSGSHYFSSEVLSSISHNLHENSKILVFKTNSDPEMVTRSGKKIIANAQFNEMQLEYGSITKLYTALEFIDLEQKGLVSRQEQIKLRNGQGVPLNDLLFHQSGISDEQAVKGQLYSISKDKNFKYSNANYALVGQYIEKFKKSSLKYEIDQSKDYSMIDLRKRPNISVFFQPAFGIVGTADELLIFLQQLEIKKLPCSQNICWGGYIKDGRFITVGKIASGTTLAAKDPDGSITILSSNDYTIDLTKILEMMK